MLDIILYAKNDSSYSWIEHGINILEENSGIAAVTPYGGPPSPDHGISSL